MANMEAVTNYAGMKALLADTVEKQREITSLRNQITGRAPRINLTTQTDEQLIEMQERITNFVEFKNRRERAVDSLRRNVQLMRSALEQSKRKPVGANPNTILDSINESLNGIQQIANQIIEVIGIERGRRQREREIAMREMMRQQELQRQEEERQRRLQVIEQRRQQAEQARLRREAAWDAFDLNMGIKMRVVPNSEWQNKLMALTDEELIASMKNLITLPEKEFQYLYNNRLNPVQRLRFLLARQEIQKKSSTKLKDEIPTDIWDGFTKSEIQNYLSVFDTDIAPGTNRSYRETYATCPICLQYVDRGEGCLFIKDHNCTKRGDGLYHRELYKKYKENGGLISFCAICSRICGTHPEGHYVLKNHDVKATLTKVRPGLAGHTVLLPGEGPCREVGGGGFAEKFMRYNALRNKAFELNRLRGKITRYEALKQMVEAAWDAPLNPPEALNTTKFTLANTAFPKKFRRTMGKIEKPKNTRILIPSDGYQEPLLVEEGTNVISYEDDPPLVQFRHIDKDGNPFDHSESLLSKLSILGHIKDGQKGEFTFKCPIAECMGYLHPEEIENAFSQTLTLANGSEVGFELDENEKKLVAYYRKLFYNAFKIFGTDNAEVNNNNTISNGNIPSIAGLFGNSDPGSIFIEMQDGTCSIGGGAGGGGAGAENGSAEGNGAEGGGANGTLEGGRRRRKSRKYRKRNRKTRKN